MELEKENIEGDMLHKYSIFTRGCFDCLHLGHFVLLTSFLLESSKLLKCKISDIKFLLSLSSQGAEIAKSIKYNDSEELRYKNLKNTNLLNEITIDRHTMPIFEKISNEIKCFCIGSDQDSRDTFKKVIKKCDNLGIFIIKLPSKIPGISSTLIRERIKKYNESVIDARKFLESNIIFDEKIRNNILILKEKDVINNRILKYFNLDSNARTQKMRKEFCKKYI